MVLVRFTDGIRRDPRWRHVMNYAARLGLVHFMRRDPDGNRRDPHWAVRGIVVLAWYWCVLLTGSDGIRGDAM